MYCTVHVGSVLVGGCACDMGMTMHVAYVVAVHAVAYTYIANINVTCTATTNVTCIATTNVTCTATTNVTCTATHTSRAVTSSYQELVYVAQHLSG
jgi:hypothetical protein